jgi:hypothetical protein
LILSEQIIDKIANIIDKNEKQQDGVSGSGGPPLEDVGAHIYMPYVGGGVGGV